MFVVKEVTVYIHYQEMQTVNVKVVTLLGWEGSYLPSLSLLCYDFHIVINCLHFLIKVDHQTYLTTVDSEEGVGVTPPRQIYSGKLMVDFE